MTLCSIEDVEALLQIDITSNADPMAVRLLELASAAVEGYVGRPLEVLSAFTFTDRRGLSRLVTPHWPLDDVTDVDEDGTTLVDGTDYEVDLASGIVSRLGGGAFASPTAVTYTTAIPAAARAVAAEVAANAFVAGSGFANRPAKLNGLRQLTIGRWSATTDHGTETRGIGVRLTPEHRAQLATLRNRRP